MSNAGWMTPDYVVHEAFDLETTVSQFLADESRSSLALPQNLSADQQKHARRLSDQHPGLKCESYGFGKENQLLLFKGSGKPVPSGGVIGQERADGAQGVRVKNTFIDDWVATEGTNGVEQPHCRSMPATPVGLLERTLQRCLLEVGDGKSSFSETAETERESVASTALDSGKDPPSPHGSIGETHAAGGDDGALANAPELPALPEGLKVRNTFIHIETMPTFDRIVQSMPDGMFRHCLQAELMSQTEPPDVSEPRAATPERAPPLPMTRLSAPPLLDPPGIPQAPPVAPAAPPPPANAEVPCGTEVEIHGLVKLPEFNGLCGTVQSLDSASGRYDVYLDCPTGACGWRWVKVKGENLQLRNPPPPCKSPTVTLTECPVLHAGRA